MVALDGGVPNIAMCDDRVSLRIAIEAAESLGGVIQWQLRLGDDTANFVQQLLLLRPEGHA
jgi:hypothetical protein